MGGGSLVSQAVGALGSQPLGDRLHPLEVVAHHTCRVERSVQVASFALTDLAHPYFLPHSCEGREPTDGSRCPPTCSLHQGGLAKAAGAWLNRRDATTRNSAAHRIARCRLYRDERASSRAAGC